MGLAHEFRQPSWAERAGTGMVGGLERQERGHRRLWLRHSRWGLCRAEAPAGVSRFPGTRLVSQLSSVYSSRSLGMSPQVTNARAPRSLCGG